MKPLENQPLEQQVAGQQAQYNEQDQEAAKNETKSVCKKCCCDYLKWSLKAGWDMFLCAARCGTGGC